MGLAQKLVEKQRLKQLRVAISTRQVCQADQVHKIREQILSTCVTTVDVFNTYEDFFQKCVQSKYSNSKLRQLAMKFSCKTARWWRVTVFQGKHINCFICMKILK
jgi:hypothetical protein